MVSKECPHCNNLGVLWGAKQISQFLECSIKHVYRLAESGSWPFFKLDGKLCARRQTLATFIAEKEREYDSIEEKGKRAKDYLNIVSLRGQLK